MLCLSILSSTASATWNLNTLSKGSVHGRYTGHVSFVCPYGYTNGGFLAIEQTVNPVSSSDICCARTTVAIQVNKVSMAMKYAFITSISLRGNSHAKIQLLAASC